MIFLKRLFSILCLFLIFILLFAGCSDTSIENPDSLSTLDNTSEGAFTRPVAPDNTVADLGGETVNILAWNEASYLEFESLTDAGTTISEALYHRNLTVSNHLNCTVNFTYVTGSNTNAQLYIDGAEANVDTDIYAAHDLVLPILVMKGYCADLLSLTSEQGLDFEQPWWPDTLTEYMTNDGAMYFCTGDISTNYIANMGVVFMNKDIITNAGINLQTIYRSVNDGVWNFETFEKYCLEAATDADKDGVVSESEIFGFSLGINSTYVEYFYKGANFRPTSNDAEGNPVFAVTDESIARENEYYNRIYSFFKNTLTSVSWSNTTLGNELFGQRRAAFTIAPLSYASVIANKVNYGILPMPRYSSERGSYSTPISSGYTLYAINSKLNEEQATEAATVLQSLAAVSYSEVLPAFSEDHLMRAYDFNDMDIHMIETIKSRGYFELLDSYRIALPNISTLVTEAPAYVFRFCVVNAADTVGVSNSYSTMMTKYKDSYASMVNDIIHMFEAIGTDISN